MTQRCLLAITGAFHLDGGIAAVNRLVIHAFAQRKLQIDLLALSERVDSAADTRYVAIDQVTYRAFGGAKFRFMSAVWAMLVSKQYDYVLFDHINLAVAAAPMRRLGLSQYGVWAFGVEVFPPRPDWQGQLGIRGADRVIAISDFTFRSVAQRFPDLPLTVCELALDPIQHGNMLPVQPTNNQPQVDLVALDGSVQRLGRHCILNVGRMVSSERYKGQRSLLQAFPAVARQFSDAQLVLAGHGDDFEYLQALAQTLPSDVQRRVFMPGFVNSQLLDQLYRACYLFAMPSVGEGFGLVYLEAMSRAKPCIGGNIDATPCVVVDGVTGLLVDDPRSPEQVAQAVLRLMHQPGQACDMGLRGYHRVRTRFLFPHFMERFWNIIEA